MRQLILKALGKPKVKKIIKDFLISEFNNHLEYGNGAFELYDGAIAYQVQDGFTDNYIEFTLEELVEFVGNKI